MAHHLLVPSEEPLSPEEIIDRLLTAFGHVSVDKEGGSRFIQTQINYLLRLKKAGKNPFGYSLDDKIQHLNDSKGKAYSMRLGDDTSKALLSTTILPGENLIFGYSSEEHYKACLPLVERCASVLGYEVEEG